MRAIKNIITSSDITGLIPGISAQRAFPTLTFKQSDPFLLLDHIGPQKVGADWNLDGAGHDHPHRGFETLSIILEGKMNHRDSLGNRTTLTSGSVQRMNAGSGIIHGGSLFSDQSTERFHIMQLWINNPQNHKMSTPEIHDVSVQEIPVVETPGIKLRVISGELNGTVGPIQTLATTQIGHLICDLSSSITISSFTDKANVMIYVLEGELTVNDQNVMPYELAQLTHNSTEVAIQMTPNSQALIMAGTPLNESIVFGGPFVMNTQLEIDQAHLDYKQGKFGTINY